MPNNIKVKIPNGQYINLAKLGHNFSDPDDETQYFSVMIQGSLAANNTIKDQQGNNDIAPAVSQNSISYM